jgi:hypothetical protein
VLRKYMTGKIALPELHREFMQEVVPVLRSARSNRDSADLSKKPNLSCSSSSCSIIAGKDWSDWTPALGCQRQHFRQVNGSTRCQ